MQYETIFSITDEQLKSLFEAGFLVIRPPLRVSQSSHVTREVFHVGTDSQILNSSDNVNKYLILLRHLKLDKQIEILIDNDDIAAHAAKRLKYQMEPIGTIIKAQCIVLHPKCEIYVEEIIKSLNGFLDWEFKLADRNDSFEVTSRISFIGQQDIQNEVNKILLLMDALCMINKVGFYVRRISTAPNPRSFPAVTFIQHETMLQPIKKEIVSDAEDLIQSSKELAIIIRGINQSYVDSCYPSRLDRLWATVEDSFCGAPEHLLSDDEKRSIIRFINSMPIAKDGNRLNRVIEAINNPDRFPKETRNERISKSISKLLKRNYEETYKEIKKCSQLRGQSGHSVSGNEQLITEAENYLRQVLIEFLDSCILKR